MAATRDRIVEATTALFMQQGLSATGLKQISEESAAPIGSLYHFFPGGKTELAAETLRLSARAYAARVGSAFAEEYDLVAGVRAAFAGAAAHLRATDYSDACPIATVALEVASSDEDLRLVTAEIFEEWLATLAALMTGAGIAPDRARQLATAFLAALEGGFLLSRAAKDTTAMDHLGESVAELVEAAMSSRRT